MTLYSPPSIPVFPAGFSPQASDMNNWIQDSFGFLTTQVVFRAEQHTSQSLSGFTLIEYDTVLEDPWGGWNGSTFAWLAPFTGWYEITLQHSISTAVTITEAVPLISYAPYEMSEVTCTSSTEGGTGASLLISLIGGIDTVQGEAWTSASVSIDVSAPGRYPSIEISYISQ